VTTTDWTTDAKGTGQYAEVNGINLYFESHGAGRPLILLHGGLGSGEMFGPVIPALAERHQVVAVDLQGHGRTADIDRPIDLRLMADDIAALMDHLGLDRPDLVGYSLGGGVALSTAARYPAKVGRLVVASPNLRPDDIYPEMRPQQGQVSAAPPPNS
jgi:pimeloyl-ACP methyl ester carboxylesterase